MGASETLPDEGLQEADEETQEAHEETQQTHQMLSTIVGLIASGAAIFGLIMLVIAVDPGRVRIGKDPGVVELIAGNRTTLIVLRIGLLCLMIYLAWSVVVLMRDRRPISSVAGVSASEVARQAQDAGEAAVDQVRRLETELDEANENISFLLGYIDELQQEPSKSDDEADNQNELA